MIATLRWRLIAVPGRLIRHARHLGLRLPPGHWVLPEVLAPAAGTARPRLTTPTLSPGSPSLSTAASPGLQKKGPHIANPAPAAGPSACPL
jgi:hypothetical protein